MISLRLHPVHASLLVLACVHQMAAAQVECNPTRLEAAHPARVSHGPIAGGNDPSKIDFAPPTDEDGEVIRTLILRDLFGRPGKGPESDLDADGLVTLADLILFLEAFDTGDLLADADGDDDVTFADFLVFMDRFDRGE